MKTCKVEGCGEKHYGKGYCNRHWQQYRCGSKLTNRSRQEPNEIRVEGDVAIITTYDKYGEPFREVIIDASDVGKVEKNKWYILKKGYVACKINGITVYLHRMLLGYPDGCEVDHINGNKADNRRSNLREASRRQNEANKGPSASNSSGFKGVCFKARDRKWYACINTGGKQRSLGYYSTAEEAALAYNVAARKHFGDFAYQNVVGY